jgi:hypothetical protein
MGTTTNGLPFPEGTDRVADGDDAIKALANAVDAKALFTSDSGWLSPQSAGFVITTPANFNSLGGYCRRRNGLACVSFSIRTLKAIGAGNITNINVLTTPAAWKPRATQPLATGTAGPVMSWHVYTSGTINIGATAAAVGANSTLTFCGLYML